jgi:hypothetical protein
MSSPRCDPIDYAAVTKALCEGIPMLTLYRAYASTAAKPYARASWERLVKTRKAKGDSSHVNSLYVRMD